MHNLSKFKLKFCFVIFLYFLISCSKIEQEIGGSDQVLNIAPYQRSAVTLVSPAGVKTKACTFERFDGKLTMTKNEPSSVTFSMQTASIATSEKKLNEAMETKFLDVKKFPEAGFQSTQIEKDASPGALPTAYLISGDLSFRGEKMKVKVPANIENNEKEVQMMFQFPVSSKDWLAKFSISPDAFFTDHMDVVAKLVFPKPVKVVDKPVVAAPNAEPKTEVHPAPPVSETGKKISDSKTKVKGN